MPLGPGASAYRLTQAGEELRPIVMGLGMWGQRWVESNVSLKNLDSTLLMWDMRRGIDASRFPPGRTTIQFLSPELEPSRRSYWLVVEDGELDLCFTDPGHEVDLFVRGSLRVMTAIWMGYTTLQAEVASGTLEAEGSPARKRAMPDWLGLSAFAGVKHASVA